nr:DUF6196 family protein [Sphingomonas sp.]
MYVSIESPAETDARLRKVIARASLQWRSEPFAFYEFPAAAGPPQGLADAVAFVRDAEVWSVLRPAGSDAGETFGLFSFHFEEGLDNSGFVAGWRRI